MMTIRVLPIHVPPCYEGGYLKPLHWNHIWLMMIIWSDPSMFHDAVSPWSLHIYHYEAMQGQGPHFPPTRKATIHIHRGEGGKGVKMGTLHWGGGGGLPNLDHTWPLWWVPGVKKTPITGLISPYFSLVGAHFVLLMGVIGARVGVPSWTSGAKLAVKQPGGVEDMNFRIGVLRISWKVSSNIFWDLPLMSIIWSQEKYSE